jgi:DNA-binding XRE family transcriptional regulator
MVNRFSLQPSSKRDGWYICTDMTNGIVCEFEKHKFNETQHFTFVEEEKVDAENLASIMREFGEWLSIYHYNIAMPKFDNYICLVKTLQYERKLQGLSQEELALKCGFQRQTINRFESGKFKANTETLIKIANALDLSLILE